jgi:hypothetical protein
MPNFCGECGDEVRGKYEDIRYKVVEKNNALAKNLRDREEEFVFDCLQEVGLMEQPHPKARLAFSVAWEFANKSGRYEVVELLRAIATNLLL